MMGNQMGKIITAQDFLDMKGKAQAQTWKETRKEYDVSVTPDSKKQLGRPKIDKYVHDVSLVQTTPMFKVVVASLLILRD